MANCYALLGVGWNKLVYYAYFFTNFVFDYLLESSHQNNSNNWTNRIRWKIIQIELIEDEFRHLIRSSASSHRIKHCQVILTQKISSFRNVSQTNVEWPHWRTLVSPEDRTGDSKGMQRFLHYLWSVLTYSLCEYCYQWSLYTGFTEQLGALSRI